jgi:hypothetical protein
MFVLSGFSLCICWARSFQSLSAQARLFKSIKLWSFYVDLEESIGTVDSTKVVYDKILELRIANAQIIVNYANFLEENHYFEDSFKVLSILLNFTTSLMQGLGVWTRCGTLHISCVLWNLEHLSIQICEKICKYLAIYISATLTPIISHRVVLN